MCRWKPSADGQPMKIETERVGPESFTVRGQIPTGAKPMLRICPVDDPAGFARALFIEKLAPRRRVRQSIRPSSADRLICPIKTRIRT